MQRRLLRGLIPNARLRGAARALGWLVLLQLPSACRASELDEPAREGRGVELRDAGNAGAIAPEGESATAFPEADASFRDSGLSSHADAPFSCIPGNTRCASPTLRASCTPAGSWELLNCDHACVDGECGGQCRPGSLECRELQPQRCDDRGRWRDHGDPCASACSQGGCHDACPPGTTQCVTASACDAGACEGTFVCVPAGARCGGSCVPGTRGCSGDTPRVCSVEGSWQDESACAGLTPLCEGAGQCRCQSGTRRCSGAQPQVCDAGGLWLDVGAACATCSEGRCPGEGCSAQQTHDCGQFGCDCAGGMCGGTFCDGDGCSAARRTACAKLGCGCVDGGCSGGFCAGSGCTVKAMQNCAAFGCECALGRCVGGACGGTG